LDINKIDNKDKVSGDIHLIVALRDTIHRYITGKTNSLKYGCRFCDQTVGVELHHIFSEEIPTFRPDQLIKCVDYLSKDENKVGKFFIEYATILRNLEELKGPINTVWNLVLACVKCHPKEQCMVLNDQNSKTKNSSFQVISYELQSFNMIINHYSQN
jgi:hypothetical protein